jgi:O-antigen/teichoic acid export membrane protein
LSETLRSDRPFAPERPVNDPSTTTGARPSAFGGVLRWAGRQARAPYVQLLVAQLCVGGTAVLANVLMARALAPSGRGLIALLLQVAYLSSQLLLLGSQRSFIAGYHGSSAAVGVRAYASLVVRPCLIGVAVVTLAATVIPAHLRPARTVLALIVAFTMVNVLEQAIRAIAIATGRYGGFLASSILGQLFLLATLTGLFLAGVTRPLVWFLGYVLATALPMVACAVLWSRAHGPGPRPAPGATLRTDQRRTVRREGLALLPAAVANMGMLRFDRLLLPALASTAALGLYATVATMTELVSWPLQAYADSRLGAWRAAHGRGRLRVSPAMLGAAVYALVVGPLLGGAIFLLIVPLFGERYGSAKALVLPLILAASMYAVSRVSLALLIGQGRNLLASGTELAGFAVSLVAYLLLIPRHGALGAAYGSLIGYGTCLAVATVALRVPTPRLAARPVPEEAG